MLLETFHGDFSNSLCTETHNSNALPSMNGISFYCTLICLVRTKLNEGLKNMFSAACYM